MKREEIEAYYNGLASKIVTHDGMKEDELFRAAFKVSLDEHVRARKETILEYRKKGFELSDKAFEFCDVADWRMDWVITQYDLCQQKKCRESSKVRRTLVSVGDLAITILMFKKNSIEAAKKEQK